MDGAEPAIVPPRAKGGRNAPGTRLGPELANLVYALGDVPNPDTETIAVLESLVMKFIEDTSKAAAAVNPTGRMHAEDVLFAVRKDPKKYARGEELMLAYDNIQDAKKAFNDPLAVIEDGDGGDKDKDKDKDND